MKNLNYFLIAVLICLVVITTIIGVDNETNRRKEIESAISNSTNETQQLEDETEKEIIYVPNYNNGAEITTTQIEKYTTYMIPNVDTSFMAYMDYRCITDTTTIQWEMQQQAYTDENGLRKIGDDYCIALGSYYTNYQCGLRFKITLTNDYSFTGIIADLKDDKHTDKQTHTHITKNGNVIEFIIDDEVMPKEALKLGNLGWYYENLNGQIKTIEKIE